MSESATSLLERLVTLNIKAWIYPDIGPSWHKRLEYCADVGLLGISYSLRLDHLRGHGRACIDCFGRGRLHSSPAFLFGQIRTIFFSLISFSKNNIFGSICLLDLNYFLRVTKSFVTTFGWRTAHPTKYKKNSNTNTLQFVYFPRLSKGGR